jgi:hypothetical protein
LLEKCVIKCLKTQNKKHFGALNVITQLIQDICAYPPLK